MSFNCSIFPKRHFLLAAELSLSLLLGGLVSPAVALDIYVSQSGAGSQNGTSAGNAYPLSWLNTSGNWGSGAGQVGPGVTVKLEGGFTSSDTSAAINIQGSGSAGNPITILFDTGAYMSSPNGWGGGNQAIYINNQNYITVDGGGTNNGAIFCTANGIGLANQVGASGISVQGTSSYITVQNLAITNIYVFSGNTWNANGSGNGVVFINGGSGVAGLTVSNCLFHDETTGVEFSYGASWSNVSMLNCTAYNCNWGGSAGDGTGSALTGLTVSGNHFYNWQTWDESAGTHYHHNGFYAYAVNTGSSMTGLVMSGNLVGPGYSTAGHSTSALFVSGNVTGMIYNNVLIGTDGTAPSSGFLSIGSTANGTMGMFNNTIVGGNNGIGIDFGPGTTGQTVNVVSNNIFLNLSTYVAQFWKTTYTYSGGYNLFYGSQNAQPFVISVDGTGSTAPLSVWTTYFDVNSQNGNPLLNPATYAPAQGSVAVGTGANLSSLGIAGLNVDANGTVRPSGTSPWTIGAFNLGITGSLEVQISPPSAVAAGSEWQVDGGTFETNGAIATNLSVGPRVVSFNTIAGWMTPGNQTVLINSNSLTTVSATYTNVPGTGGLIVTILPQAAVATGAAWQTNGGPFVSSGTVFATVPAGSCLVNFNTNIANWTPPPPETLAITPGHFTQVTNYYTQFGLHVIIPTTNNLNGLVGWWTLDDLSGTDLSGNSNTLTFNGSPSFVSGEITNAVSFNGSSQYADAGSGAGLNPAAITVMAWVNFNSLTPAYSAVVSKVDGPQTAFYQVLASSAGKLALYAGATGGTARYNGTGTYALSTGTWYHVALTYSSTNGLVGYVNGHQDGTAPANGALTSNSGDTLIGNDNSTSGRYANAIIDDVRIYNRALSASEIAGQYQWPTGGRP